MRRYNMLLVLCTLMLLFAPALAQETFPPASEPTIYGIDVSDWQGTIDFSRVAASGVRIVYIRATEGANFVDREFANNYRGAKAAGIAVGFYHYLTANSTQEAVAQADFFLATVADTPADCIPAMDFGGGSELSATQFRQVAEAFLSRVQTRTNANVMIYSDAYGARTRYDATFARYPLWVANYGVTLPEANDIWNVWYGFQYSDRGNVPGITDNCDMDRFTKEVYLGTPPTPSPTPTPTPKASNMRYTVAREGQTYASIAARYGAVESDIRAHNLLADAQPVPGQVIGVPGGEAPASGNFASAFIAPNASTPYYTALHFGLTEDELRAVNTLPNEFRIYSGQVVFLPPVTGREGLISSPDTLLALTYVASAGDTLASVASSFGLNEIELSLYNGLPTGARIYSGQILHLTAFGISDMRGFYGAYVTRRGDTLTRIAARFDTTVDALVAANEIKNKNLLVTGQVLVIPRE